MFLFKTDMKKDKESGPQGNATSSDLPFPTKAWHGKWHNSPPSSNDHSGQFQDSSEQERECFGLFSPDFDLKGRKNQEVLLTWSPEASCPSLSETHSESYCCLF